MGRLPLGPAGDAANAAAALREQAGERRSAGSPQAGERRAAGVLDRGAATRGVLLRRAVPVAAVLGAAAMIAIRLSRRR